MDEQEDKEDSIYNRFVDIAAFRLAGELSDTQALEKMDDAARQFFPKDCREILFGFKNLLLLKETKPSFRERVWRLTKKYLDAYIRKDAANAQIWMNDFFGELAPEDPICLALSKKKVAMARILMPAMNLEHPCLVTFSIPADVGECWDGRPTRPLRNHEIKKLKVPLEVYEVDTPRLN